MKEKNKIILITGSYPPSHCGVGDYTSKLFESLEQTGEICVDLFCKSNWSIKNYFNYLQKLRNVEADIYHFQYPTEGYGYSFLPLLLVGSLFTKKTVLTVHELSSRNRMAYIYTQLLILFSKKVIVSNSLEFEHASRFVYNKKKVFIIPIGSNIQESDWSNTRFTDRKIDLAYFGHIRPIKGLESFLKTVLLIDKKWNVNLIGQVLDKYLDFYKEVKVESEKLNIELVTNKTETDVANLLADVKIVYLPFPDGISSRRGTLLAAIQNGCTIVSTKSTTREFNIFFSEYCYLVDSNEQAVEVITQLLTGEICPKENSVLKYIFSWNRIVSEHLSVYELNVNKRIQ